MSFQINEFADITAFIQSRAQSSDNGLFREAIENALTERENNTSLPITSDSYVVVSPKFEEKLKADPELAEEITQKINEMCRCYGENCRDNIVVVDRNGEITRYCTKHDKNKDYPTAEQLKELAKARARKKARLDAYFKLVERISIKRKLIEQENAKRAVNKKYRYSVGQIDLLAKSILQKPTKEPQYYS
ncbi:MAG: hypothetical protein HDT43_01185 [Ruminococcaceae bacterium]|nr:hypothetical protein [Oscillospiraceae bacterium]